MSFTSSGEGPGLRAEACAPRLRHKTEEAPERPARGPRESSGDLLSRTRRPGTIGDVGLNCRVRNGNGCDPHSITAETMSNGSERQKQQGPNDEALAGPGCPRSAN